MTRIVLPPPSHATGDPGNPGAVAASSSQYSSSRNKGFAVQPSKQLVEDPVALWRRNNPQPNSLPPITSLYEVLNADLNNEQEELAKNVNYRVWNIVASSVQPINAPRIDNRNHVCEDFIVCPEDIKCLDAGRKLTMWPFAAFARLIRKHFTEHPLNAFIPQEMRPKILLMDPGALALFDKAMIHIFIDEASEVITSHFSKDAWKFWYCDSRPWSAYRDEEEGDGLIYKRLRNFTQVACRMAKIEEDLSKWTQGSTISVDRQTRHVDSGLWVLADIEAWFLGKTYADPETDMDAYRRVVRQALVNLPIAGPDHKDFPITPYECSYIYWRNSFTEALQFIEPIHFPHGKQDEMFEHPLMLEMGL
ncbi:hypothetical protein M422DRAFT_259352 [Sphaerobolus stellatus SS14]|uniref:Uncharacterized protein n=1 Tax=Sphaerobolus stellatus (strain SS14) TaxID=990650 RepID=A0A0C9USZ8_SPHS4|nr:hypothetical protein M422DRAFT_259352 [Sphaerobolus stellatus SS14]